MKILVLGYIVRGPLGGMTWHHFQYILGLKKLGYEVLFLEQSGNYPSCYNPETFLTSEDPSYGLKYLASLFHLYDLDHQWAYFDEHTNSWFGRPKDFVVSFCSGADIVLNLSGINSLDHGASDIPARVFIDTDPVFTQVRHLVSDEARELAGEHNFHFSFAENIGKSDCKVPADGFNWKATRQPVYLPLWKMAPMRQDQKWTTVMQWDSYKEAVYNGTNYGMKSASFSKFQSLPSLLPLEKFELALGNKSAPRQQLVDNGWLLEDPFVATSTPLAFQQYIAGSKGECTVAKHGYVVTNSGWFSERTLNYMASGKPVVVQDTGFTKFLPSNEGLLSFTNVEEAVSSINRINADYNRHCIKARGVVEDHFNSDKVLYDLLNRIY